MEVRVGAGVWLPLTLTQRAQANSESPFAQPLIEGVLDILSSNTEEVLGDGNEGTGILGLPKPSFAYKHSPKWVFKTLQNLA